MVNHDWIRSVLVALTFLLDLLILIQWMSFLYLFDHFPVTFILDTTGREEVLLLFQSVWLLTSYILLFIDSLDRVQGVQFVHLKGVDVLSF